MKPLGHRVLVLPIVEKQTKTGIIIPEKSVKQNKGKVVELGTAVDYLSVGDEVIYHENGGTEIGYNGKKHILLACGPKQNDVICVV